MTPEEIRFSIKYEAEQYIPFDINDVNIDFEIIGPKSDEEGQMELLLIAAKKNVISDYEDVVEMAGLDPVILDTDAFALSNMYELNYAGTEKKIVALVNIGASKTNINVLYEGRQYSQETARWAVITTRRCWKGNSVFPGRMRRG